MKRIICISILLLFCLVTTAQEKPIDSSYATEYYQQRLAFFNSMPDRKNEIVFLGNSITEQGPWHELLPGKVVNRGIGGDNTFGVLARLNEVLSAKPAKIFLLIGINDLGRGLPISVIINNYKRIINQVRSKSPSTRLYIQGVLPLNDSILRFAYLKGKNASVKLLNEEIKKLSQQMHFTWIDLSEIFSDDKGELKAEFTLDGIHLKSSAYIEWVNLLKKYNHL